MNNIVKKSFFAGGLAAVFLVVFVGGIYLGYNNRPAAQKIVGVLNMEDDVISQEVDFESFWKTWNLIESKYVSNDGLDKQDMVWGASEGLVASLDDPYSVFFPPKEAEIFEETVRGDFGGVGMEVGIRNNVLTVVAPLKGTPAYKSGIMAGDMIIKIDDTVSADLTVDEAVQLIRGEKGTAVKLTILRPDNGAEPLEIEIVRDIITVPVIETEVKEDGVFVIRLFSFSAHSMSEFRNALREMIESGSYKLVLDLRGNAGGYLEAAVDIASWFLPLGDVVAREQFGDSSEQVYSSKGYYIFRDLPMVILVNEGSASASEIVAGALSEHGIATLVGKKTFGKGSVQELVPVGDGSSLKITIARWLTPNGSSISQNGLDPDIEVDYTMEDYEADLDPQMERALEMLKDR